MLISSSNITIKKSKFIGYLEEINSIEEIDLVLKKYEKEHKKATHLCIGILFETYEKFRNDKEVGGPGKLLLELLKQNKLDSHILIVARYYGGIKLGQGGVQRAFREIGNLVIKNKNKIKIN